jgi:protein-disulfide isomerase
VSKQFLAVIIVVILALVGVFAFTGNKASDSSQSTSSKGQPTNHVQGQGKSGVTLVEYGDYQCPYCQQYYPILKQVQAQFNDQIYFQFRNFPIINVHQNAFAGARAAEAAALQDKFWEMHDLLYENQSQWSESSDPSSFFKQYAKQLGLNVDQFQKDYASSQVNDAINADLAAGRKLGVQGTPTFFLDGKEIKVNASAASFEKQIKEAIAKKSASSQNQ